MSDNMAQDYASAVADGIMTTIDRGESAARYAADILDVRRTYDNTRVLVSVSLLVSFGGPNTWVEFDGRTADVTSYWGGDTGHMNVYCPEWSESMVELFDTWNVEA